MFMYSSGSQREASILGWSSSPGNCSQMQTPRPAESETRAVPSTACFTWPPRGLQCLPWCARCQSVLEIQSVSQSLRKIDLRENGASEEKQDLTIASCYPQFHSNFSRARICSIVPLMGLRPHATVWDLLFSCRHLCPAGVRKCVAKDVCKRGAVVGHSGRGKEPRCCRNSRGRWGQLCGHELQFCFIACCWSYLGAGSLHLM